MTNLPAIIERGQLSEEIGDLLKSNYLPLFGTDDNPRAGTEYREAWAPPKSVTEEIKREARRALAEAEKALEPPNMDARRKWLAAVGTLCAGKMSASDAESKLAAYAELLGHPRAVFTRGSLKRAGARFRWFPSFAEINEFLDDEAGPYFRFVQRLRTIANSPLRLAPQRPQTGAERLAMGHKLEDMRRGFEAMSDADRAKRRKKGFGEAQPISVVSQRLREQLSAQMRVDRGESPLVDEDANVLPEAPYR